MSREPPAAHHPEVEVVAAGEQQHLACADPHARRLGALEDPHLPVGAPGADGPEQLLDALVEGGRGRLGNRHGHRGADACRISGLRMSPSVPPTRKAGVSSCAAASESGLPATSKPASRIMR